MGQPENDLITCSDDVRRVVPGFVLLAVSTNDGECEQAIETTAVEDFCVGCGVLTPDGGRER